MRRWIGLLACGCAGALGCATGHFGPDAGTEGPGDGSISRPDGSGSRADAFVLRFDANLGPDARLPDAAIPDAYGADGPCVDTGAACATGSPGACASGHEHCVSGFLACVPDQTTQTCYDGRAGTAGTGTCQAGTQSCVGGLGACVGEVVPTNVDDCFTPGDDDCDGVANDGCPDHIVLGSSYSLTAEGGGGGNAFTLSCPAGKIVARSQIYFDYGDAEASGISIWCVTPSLTKGASSYQLTASAMPGAATAVSYGANTTMPPNYDVNCTIAGGLGAVWETYTRFWSPYLEGLGVWCATATATLDQFNDLTINVAGNGSGGGGSYAKTPFSDVWQDCNADSVVVGFKGRDALWLDQIQPVCAPIQVVYQ